MSTMNSATVIPLNARGRRLARAIDARRQLGVDRRGPARPTGRAWVNGSELGGTRAALAHLTESYD